MLPQRHVRLFRNGSNQALRIPREFELPGNEAIMKKDGNRLIIESVLPSDLLGLLASWDALDVDFPDIDADALPLNDVDL
jgi:antitoxin VapB